jgi:N-acetylglucosaminyldiphosphoundecaprenol N-acetyl-beta-D-mannosaminyltransferase
MESFALVGVRIEQVDFALTLALVEQWCRDRLASPAGRCRQICTVNPEFIVDATRDPAFAQVLAQADLCVPDGIGVILAARLQGIRLTERVTGSDGIYRLAELAARTGLRMFLLGAAPGVAAQAAERLAALYPGLVVAGACSGSPRADEWPTIYAQLVQSRPDLLLVAFGHPRQDFWIAAHRHELPAAVAIGVGGAFDFVAGVTQRAPERWQRLGLEWLHRLVHEPWRWRRMMKLPVFAGKVVWDALLGK